MEISNKKVWVILSKDRKLIAKGTPRNRELILIENVKDRKRILTYSSKGQAESGFLNNWFRTWGLPDPYNKYTKNEMEAVEVNLTMTIHKPN